MNIVLLMFLIDEAVRIFINNYIFLFFLMFCAAILFAYYCALFSRYLVSSRLKDNNSSGLTAREFWKEEKIPMINRKYKGGGSYCLRNEIVMVNREVLHSMSVIALAILGHEFGHAAQHRKYPALWLLDNRGWVLTGSVLTIYILSLIGTKNTLAVAWCVFALFGAYLTANLVVEADASLRSLSYLRARGLTSREINPARLYLGMAWGTYAGGFLASALLVVGFMLA